MMVLAVNNELQETAAQAGKTRMREWQILISTRWKESVMLGG
jgi:hypothetical protein